VICDTCGQVHKPTRGKRPCKGHIKNQRVNGESVPYPEDERPPCRGVAMIGQGVCHSHGGRAPQSKAAGAERAAQQEAGRLMLTYGERVEVDPGEEMLDLICWTAGHVRWLRARVQQLEEEQQAAVWVEDDDAEDGTKLEVQSRHSLVWSVTKNKVGGGDSGTTYEAKPNIYLGLYNTETDRLAKLCSDAIRIGLKDREVRLAERQGDLVMRILDGVLSELGHNPSDPVVAGAIVRHLRAVN